MQIILNLVFGGIAWLIGVLGLSNYLIIARFAKPFTKHLEKNSFKVDKRIYTQFSKTQTIWMVILLGLIVVVYWFFPYRFFAFVIGYILAFISCWKTTGATQANFGDYLKAYNEYLAVGFMENDWSEEEFNQIMLSFLCP